VGVGGTSCETDLFDLFVLLLRSTVAQLDWVFERVVASLWVALSCNVAIVIDDVSESLSELDKIVTGLQQLTLLALVASTATDVADRVHVPTLAGVF
jgi:hypothetical protein